jgi:hypothetical protein
MKYSWSIPTSDIDIINSNYNSHYKLTAEQLLEMARDLVTHPRKYVDIIFSLQKRYLELAEVNNNNKKIIISYYNRLIGRNSIYLYVCIASIGNVYKSLDHKIQSEFELLMPGNEWKYINHETDKPYKVYTLK